MAFGAKTVPRNQANENSIRKTEVLSGLGHLKIKKKCRKTLSKYREGRRTVGSGRVATIIE